MKKKKAEILLIALILNFAIFGCYESFRKNGVIADRDAEIAELKIYKNIIDSINGFKKQNEINKFNFVKERFIEFNHEVNDSTVLRFIEISEHFKLDSTNEMFNLFVHEIILESGAQQYYQSTHPKEGQLVTSYAGAIGIGQIMPNTAFSFLKRIVDSTEMYNLECENFNWITKDNGMYSPNNPETREKIIEWLSNENNNIALWGVIMRYSLNKNNNNVYHALISYNAGGVGLRSFLNSGRDPNTHSYIKGILQKENIVDALIDDNA